jgi:hypothetical protein
MNYSWLPEYKNSDHDTNSKSSPAVGEFLAFKFGSQIQHYNYLFSHWKVRYSFLYCQLLKVLISNHLYMQLKTNSPSFAANFHLNFF